VDPAPDRVRARLGAELRGLPLRVLEETAESLALARNYVEAGAIPAACEDDARHIAIATVHDVRIIVFWNFRHMVNIDAKRKINGVNVREGLPMLDLVSPWEAPHEEE
jgi:hypothetical protein